MNTCLVRHVIIQVKKVLYMYRQKSKLLKRFNGKLGVINSKTAYPSLSRKGCLRRKRGGGEHDTFGFNLWQDLNFVFKLHYFVLILCNFTQN
jgi:hypothetical protein